MIRSLAAACSPLRLMNRPVPVLPSEIRGAAYGPGARHRLDAYPTAAAGSGRRVPVVVFFYGGSWQSGSRGDYRFAADALRARGLLAVVPDYRLYPEVRFPAFVEDAARAVAWVREHAAELGGDPDRIFLMGHSAGAHLAALLALDPRRLAGAGVPRSAVRGAVGLAGPYDFLPFRGDTFRDLFGPEAGWPETQPIRFAAAAAPPMLLLTGGRDATVRPGNSVRLAARLREHGADAQVKIYPRLGHGTILAALSRPLRFLAPVVRDVEAFVRERSAPV